MTEAEAYGAGYRDGESSEAADWLIALDDVLPDDLEARPSVVAKYIEQLQEAVRAAASPTTSE